MKQMLRVISVLIVIGLAACQSTPSKQAALAACDQKVIAETGNDVFMSTAWQQQAAEYQALSLQAYVRAEAALKLALDDPKWAALDPIEVQAAPTTSTLAIIADIDETVLDNSAFNVREMRVSAAPCETPDEARERWGKRWSDWVSDAEAPAMPGAAEFMQQAVKAGVEVYYVTNRKDHEKAGSCKNLLRAGFPLRDCETHVLTRNDDDGRGRDKVSRRQQIASTHRVVMLFGDNLGDFAGNILGSHADRAALVSARRDWWGARWFMLPNPSYGSWDEVLGHVDGGVPEFATAAERRAHLRAIKEQRLEDCTRKDCLQP